MLDYVILILLIVCLLALIITIILLIHYHKKRDDHDLYSSLGSINTNINNLDKSINNSIANSLNIELSKMKDETNKQIKEQYTFLDSLKKDINNHILNIQNQVNNSITDGFKTNNEQIEKVTTSLTIIDDAKNNIVNLSKEVNSLNSILSYSNKAGKYGEHFLGNILRSTFGDNNIFEEQYSLTNNANDKVIADAVIHLDAKTIICIDSKFSVIKYKNLISSPEEYKKNKQTLISTLKGQIDKIANDYIIDNVTLPYALMFIANDGFLVFLENDEDIYMKVMEYAAKKKVIIVSPTTLQPILANINFSRIRIETINNIDRILEQLNKIRSSLGNYNKLMEEFSKDIDDLKERKDEFMTKGRTLSRNIDNVLKLEGDKIDLLTSNEKLD